MSEPTDLPVEPVVDFLSHTKQVISERIVSHMNGVGASIVNAYPMAEVQSWTIQKQEADSLLALEVPSILDVQTYAPFLLAVSVAHYGPATDDAARVAQVVNKAVGVKDKAGLWSALAAFVNGLRARAQDRIDAAGTLDEVFTIESETQTELGAFRAMYAV